MLTKAQGDEMESWFQSEDLKDYSAPVRFMDAAVDIAVTLAVIACLGMLCVVALGWPS